MELMKFLVTIGVVFVAGFILWYGVNMMAAVHTCDNLYSGKLSTERMQEIQSGDHGRYCTDSYSTIVSWQQCVNATGNAIPKRVAVYLKPWSMSVLRALHDPGLMLDTATKLEHDDLCKDQINTMFNPPTPL